MKSTTYERVAQCAKGRDVAEETARKDAFFLRKMQSAYQHQSTISYVHRRIRDLEKYGDPRARIFLVEVARIKAGKACAAAVNNAKGLK